MANPNIVSVSSILGESIGKGLTTDVTTVMLTVASNKLVKINYIQVANLDASTATLVSVSVTKAAFTSGGVGSGDDEAGIVFQLVCRCIKPEFSCRNGTGRAIPCGTCHCFQETNIKVCPHSGSGVVGYYKIMGIAHFRPLLLYNYKFASVQLQTNYRN